MREVREIRVKLQRLKSNLLRSDTSKATSGLHIFWKFIHEDPFIAPIVAELASHDFDFDRWYNDSRQRRGYSFPNDEREVAAMCLEVLNPSHYPSDRELWSLSLNLMLTSENNLNRMVQAFFEAFVPPLFEYIDERLLGRESMVTPSDIMLAIADDLHPDRLTKYPKTAEALETAYRKLLSESGPVVWQAIGTACRAALIAFANEIFEEPFIPSGEEAPKGDDAKRKISLALRHHYMRNSTRGPYEDALENLVKATWDLASALIHRKDAREFDAKMAVMETYLVIWYVAEIASIE